MLTKFVIPGKCEPQVRARKGDPGGRAPSVHQYLDPLPSRANGALAGDDNKSGKLL
jgi:hypothetical protein